MHQRRPCSARTTIIRRGGAGRGRGRQAADGRRGVGRSAAFALECGASTLGKEVGGDEPFRRISLEATYELILKLYEEESHASAATLGY